MTAIITIKRPDEIIIITDGKTQIGTGEPFERTISKVALLPKGPALLAARGVQSIPTLVGARANVEGWGFDDLVQNVEALIRLIFEDLKRAGQPCDLADQEMTLAGYSTRESRLIAYFMPCGDKYAELPAFALREIEREAAPPPSAEAEKAAGFKLPLLADEFDPLDHGVRLMDAQRRTYPDAVGGFVQVSRVTREEVSSRIVHRWA